MLVQRAATAVSASANAGNVARLPGGGGVSSDGGPAGTVVAGTVVAGAAAEVLRQRLLGYLDTVKALAFQSSFVEPTRLYP